MKPNLIYHICVALRFAELYSDDQLDGLLVDQHGKRLSAAEVRAEVQRLRARGYDVFPRCDHVDAQGHCLGHEPGETE